MHFIACAAGELKVRAGTAEPWQAAAGVLTAADAAHAVDASGAEILIVERCQFALALHGVQPERLGLIKQKPAPIGSATALMRPYGVSNAG